MQSMLCELRMSPWPLLIQLMSVIIDKHKKTASNLVTH